jgi:hypothetical protein
MNLNIKIPTKLAGSLMAKQDGKSLSSLVVQLLREYDSKCIGEKENVGDKNADRFTKLHHAES